MIEHLYDRRSVQTIDGPLCHANGIALAQRQEAATESHLGQPSISLVVSFPLAVAPFPQPCRPCAAQRASTSRSRATNDTSESSLYMVGPSPSGRRPVNGRDSLFADGISGRRTNEWPSGRRGEEEIPRSVARDLCRERRAYPVAPQVWIYGGLGIIAGA